MSRESLSQGNFFKQTVVSGSTIAAGIATAETGVAQDSMLLKLVGIGAGISGIVNFFRALDNATRVKSRRALRRR